MEHSDKWVIINLRDCFFHVIYHWKSIILAAIIGALLFGGYALAKAQFSNFLGKNTSTEIEYQQNLEKFQQQKNEIEANITSLTDNFESAINYKEKSILYNALNLITAKRVYSLQINSLNSDEKAEEKNQAATVLLLYQTSLLNDADIVRLKELFKVEELEYISEVVNVSKTEDGRLITLEIVGKDIETVEREMEYLSSVMETITKGKIQKLVSHELLFLTETNTVEVSEEYLKNQKLFDERFTAVQANLEKNIEELENLKIPTLPTISRSKYALIGLFVGAILMVLYYVASYVLSGILHTAKELQIRYSIPLYGDYPSHRARGHLLSSIIDKWEFHGVNTDTSSISKSICSLLHETCIGKKVVLTGTVSKDQLTQLQVSLQRQLEDDIMINIVPDFLSDGTAIVNVKKADAVLIVEQKYSTKIEDLDRIISMLSIAGARIIGSIVL